MNFSGTVTSLNKDLVSFEINNAIVVYILFHRKVIYLPKLGGTVEVRKAHYHSNLHRILIVFLCDNSFIKGDLEDAVTPFDNDCLSFIRNNKVGASDMLELHKNYVVLKKHNKEMSSTLLVNIMMSLGHYFMESNPNLQYGRISCCNSILRTFTLETLLSCCSVTHKGSLLSNFPYWSFGHHPRNDRNTFLFGYLCIHINGSIVIKDSQHHMPCIVSGITYSSLNAILNHYVIFKKYTVITEIYGDHSVNNLEYLIVSSEDIQVIYSNEDITEGPVLFYEVPPKIFDCSKMLFEVIRKSEVCVSQEQLEFWLEITIKEKNGVECVISAFLCLSNIYVKIKKDFELRSHYWMYFRKELKEARNIEIKRIASHVQYDVASTRAVFAKDRIKVAQPEKIMNVKQTKEFIQSFNGFLSFKGVLKLRKFNNPLSSRTQIKTSLQGFGTPGTKTHLLEFAVEDDKIKTLCVYLNNWEQMLTPLGLIPGANVIMRNVIPQKGKYCKSTVFTTIEIVSFVPQIQFQTSNLCDIEGFIEWGEPTYLGLGSQIPAGVLCWGKITNLLIDILKIKTSCATCGSIGQNRKCSCEIRKINIEVLIILLVSDEFGQSKIISKTEKLLKMLLNCSANQYQSFLKAFEDIMEYNFNRFKTQLNVDTRDMKSSFKNALSRHFKAINACGMNEIELKCRKLDSRPDENEGRPLWFLIDVR